VPAKKIHEIATVKLPGGSLPDKIHLRQRSIAGLYVKKLFKKKCEFGVASLAQISSSTREIPSKKPLHV